MRFEPFTFNPRPTSHAGSILDSLVEILRYFRQF